ncbi:YadA C-terminal domain-containing protein [Enterobacter roggenkampii]|uniref:YadA C-terminal domain-containing protein n=1 Tax=Enterobacter roggenkampii TaxID=1812935 RepID=UPI0018F63F00|nr:YadA-like family protein [Enterobacter roggenkampii]
MHQSAGGGGNIAIGNNATVDNAAAATAIGNRATATAVNSVAVGYGSVADRIDTVSVGGNGITRQITNVAAGTVGTDAVNVNQLNDKAAGTLKSANEYSTQQITKVVEYTDQKTAKTRIDANNYTDSKLIEANNHTDSQIKNVTSIAVEEANYYTDQQVNNEALLREQGDADTLKKANDYSDTGDARTLSSANNYTNSKFAELKNSVDKLSDRVDRNRKRSDAGIAGAMAMTGIPVVYGKDTSFGMAMSGYRNQSAVAAGFNFRTSKSSALKVNVAWDTQSGVGVAGGFALGW